jgi:hypothetical protein
MELQELEAQIPSAVLWELYCTWRVNPYGSLLEAWEVAYSDNEIPKRVKGLAKQIERAVKALGDN